MENTKRMGRQAAILLAGAAVLSFGMYNIHEPCGITEGGVLGAMLLAHHWLGVSPGVIGPVLDGLCYLVGLRVFGVAFLLRAMVASGAFSVWYMVWEHTGPLFPDLSAVPLAAAVVGGLFVGVGVGFVVRAGGAAGGDDVLALVLARAAGWPLARAYFLFDAVVLTLSFSYIPAGNVLCSLVTVTLSSAVIDRMQRPQSGRAARQ